MGSEMCIRDRFGTGTSLEGNVVGNENGITISLEKMNKVLSVCLLYTSDAADDLLCVDLGGRRIIKKNL